MGDQRRDRVRAVFGEAADLPPDQRAAYLDAACAGDPQLRAEVESLLAYDSVTDDAAGDAFLKSPVARPSHVPIPTPLSGVPAVAPLPQHIGNYRILRELGSGGMGTVYEAEQDNPRRAVALKVIRPGVSTPGLVRRFTHEAQILGRLQHPGIAQVYEAGLTADGQPYFVMELVAGVSLDRYVRQRALDVPARLGLFARVCDAVQHAHDRGVIHRDLKPGNILVDGTGQPKVLDFGVARATDADFRTTASRTEAGQIVGTLNYMSPEQLAGDPALVDRRADVYALGVLLFELLADQLPYDLAGLPLPEAARVIRDQDPSSLGSVCRSLRGDVETIVATALEKDRTRRYASADELAADVRRHLSHEPIRARPPSAAYLLRKFARRHKPLVAGAAGVVAALVVGMIGTTWFALEEAEQRRLAEDKTRDEAAARAQAETNRALAEMNLARAEENRRDARRNLYLANVRLTLRAWEQGQATVMRGLLDEAARGGPGDEDLRGFEWHFLRRKAYPEMRTLDGPTGYLTDVTYSPNGKFLACAGGHGTVIVWDGADGRQIHVLKAHQDESSCVCFSPDNQRLASSGMDGQVRVWDVATGTELCHWWGATRVEGLAFSPDGRWLASGGWSGAIHVWDSHTGEKKYDKSGAHPEMVMAVAFSPDGRFLASAGADGMARVWNAADGTFLLQLVGHTGYVHDVTFSPDGNRLATAGRDHTARVWDAKTGMPVATFTGHREMVWGVAFSPDGTHVVSGSRDRTVRIWRADDGAEVALVAHSAEIKSVAFSPDGARVAAAVTPVVRVWQRHSPSSPPPLQGHTKAVLAVAFSPDGQRVASGGMDRSVHLWEAFGGKKIADRREHTKTVRGVAFSPTGDALASAGDDGHIRLWDAIDGRPLRTLNGHTPGSMLGVAFHPNGRRLASAGRDGIVRIWDVADGREVFALPKRGGDGHVGSARGVAFSPDGKRVASAGEDRTVRVWDAESGELLRKLTGHKGAVNGVVFGPDGRLVSGGDDYMLRVWDVEAGRVAQTLVGHTGLVSCVAFSPGGARLASVDHDGMVCLWDAATGKQLLMLRGSAEELFALAFSPDGLWLALAGRTPSVRVW
ncbi:protein kinase [bacterium]|nr:protein kinase [bacterium]